jgi:hypothetical protein
VCGHPRSSSARYCTACGAPFSDAVSTGTPVAEPPAAAPPLPVTDEHPDTVSAYRPPRPTQTGDVASQQPSGRIAEQDPFRDLYEPRSGERAGSAERFGMTAAEHRTESAEAQYLTPAPPTGRRKALVAVIIAVAVLAAAGGVAAWATHRHQARLSALPAQPKHRGTSQSANGSSPSPTPSLTSTPSPSPTNNGSLVSVAPGVTQDLEASRVEAFLNRYFTAINGHNYREYLALLDQTKRQDESAHDFDTGYDSTTDSHAMLNAITSTGPGSVGAAVSFTSHQLPADSPSDTACTDWNITLYLTRQGSRYVLGPTPPSYHAAYQPC